MVPPNERGKKIKTIYKVSLPASVDHWCHQDQDILLVKLRESGQKHLNFHWIHQPQFWGLGKDLPCRSRKLFLLHEVLIMINSCCLLVAGNLIILILLTQGNPCSATLFGTRLVWRKAFLVIFCINVSTPRFPTVWQRSQRGAQNSLFLAPNKIHCRLTTDDRHDVAL